MDLMYLVFTRMASYNKRFWSLLFCPLSVERYYFPLCVDSTQALLALFYFRLHITLILRGVGKNEVEIVRKPCIRQTGSRRKQSHRFLTCTRLQTGELTAGTGKQDPGASIAISFSLALCLKQ